MVDQEVTVEGKRGWICESGDQGYYVGFYEGGKSWHESDKIEIYKGADDYPDWLGLVLVNDEDASPWIALRFDPDQAGHIKALATARDISVEELLAEMIGRGLEGG